MKKKIILSLVLLLLIIIARLLYNSVSPVDRQTNRGQLQNEQVRIMQKIKKIGGNTTEQKTLKKINDFSLTTKTLLKKYSATSLQKIIQKETLMLSRCLKKDFCGMTVNEKRGYFDESEVGGAKQLKHQLRRLVELVQQDAIIATSVELPFFDIFSLPNKESKILALRLLLKKDASSEQLTKLLRRQDFFNEESRGEFYKLIFKKVLPSSALRTVALSSLLTALRDKDNYLVLTLLEASGEFNLTEDEFEELIQASCFIKHDPTKSHNWKMVYFALSEAIAKNHYTLIISESCQ